MTVRFCLLTLSLLFPGAALAQGGDPAIGMKQFAQCRPCHATAASAPDGLGTNLTGVYGKKAATLRKAYKYSPALKASGLVWDDATLDRWIMNPAATVKGTKMVFMGIAAKPARQNIIAYLKTLK